jgi:hypothetical protein
MNPALLLFRDRFVASTIWFRLPPEEHQFHRENPGRYRSAKALKLPQQPKTSPDGPFELAAGSETLGSHRNASETLEKLGRFRSQDAQEKTQAV